MNKAKKTPGIHRILIAEGIESVALEIRSQITKLGYEIIEVVKSAESALLSTEALKPSLVIVDLALPGVLDGIEPQSIPEGLDGRLGGAGGGRWPRRRERETERAAHQRRRRRYW